MKKSIYKITGWSVALSAALVLGMYRTHQSATPKVQGFVSTSGIENGDEQSQGNTTTSDYNSYASNEYEQTTTLPNSITSSPSAGTSTSTNSATNNSSVAFAPSMGINQFGEDGINNINTNEEYKEDALAKGGPNNSSNEYQQGQQNNNSSSSTVVTGSTTITTGSNVASSSSGTAARVSSPTVVTAPPSPSGSTGGGSGGDPFVPIDDYYGLIFLITVSTLVGVFTIKKSKMI